MPPYLSSFQVMKIQTRFQIEGISKRTISLEDQIKLLLEGKEIEEINFEGSQLEKQVINKGTNAHIVKELMEECIKDGSGVLPGKTIFFCSSMAHARRIEEIFDKLFPQYKGELAKVLVSDDPRVYGKGGLLDQFTNSDMPRVAISVDMLDTGIDIRAIVNLVFAKPVYSYTKFWQMIGRGTRLLETSKPKPWCTEKDRKHHLYLFWHSQNGRPDRHAAEHQYTALHRCPGRASGESICGGEPSGFFQPAHPDESDLQIYSIFDPKRRYYENGLDDQIPEARIS